MTDMIWFFVFWSFLLALLLLEWIVDPASVSTRRDTRWPANLAMGLLNGAVASLLPVSLIWISIRSEENGLGLLNMIFVPAWADLLVTLIALSLGQYIFHRLMHASPTLWTIHQVHHSDQHLDASTGLRFHPFEMLLNLAFMSVIVVATGPDAVSVAISEALAVFIGIFTHTNLALPPWLDRLLRILFITPNLHELHHSDDRAEYETNFGAVFSLWDRVFGTFLPDRTRTGEQFRVGIRGLEGDEVANLRKLLGSPLRRSRTNGP